MNARYFSAILDQANSPDRGSCAPRQAGGEFAEALHDDVGIMAEEVGQNIGGFAVDRDAEGADTAPAAVDGARLPGRAVVRLALDQANLALGELDAIAVTNGPGLVGALLVGLSYAKGLAYASGLPFLGVHHIASHIAANYLTYPTLEPPFTCLVASGGHSHIILVEDYDRYRLIGHTRDDAAGEAFDKVARVLGLSYPGGPNLEALAREGDPTRYRFRSAFNEGDGFDFSFSGIKTAVVNRLHNAEQAGETVNRADLAASFQKTVVDILAEKSVRAAKAQAGEAGKKLALAGGVSANRALREAMEQRAAAAGVAFYCPDFAYCTDNAAMVGSAAYGKLLRGQTDSFALNAVPYLSIEESFVKAK